MGFEGRDLKNRWKKILTYIEKSEKFIPKKGTFRKSIWWKTGKVGAVFLEGNIKRDGKNTSAILKIQGVRPETSEYEMIKAFGKHNKSRIIRPPEVYVYVPWDEDKQFEALIFEKVDGKPVITHNPPTDEELNRFFDLYHEYREKCRRTAWVEKPKYSYSEHVDRWLTMSEKQRKKDKLGMPGDWELMERGIEIVEREIKTSGLEFVHGHLTSGDLIEISKGDVVLFSNLFWGWRVPFYDAVFEYHWKMLWLARVRNLTSDMMETERKRWMDKLNFIPQRKLNLALLERAVPALMVDRIFLDWKKESTAIVVEGCRKELRRLIRSFS